MSLILEIEGYRLALTKNSDGSVSPVIAGPNSGGAVVNIEIQGNRIQLAATGATDPISGEPTFALVCNAPVQTASITLTAAQLFALHSTPIQVLPAPGAKQAYLIENSMAIYHFGGTPFGGNGLNVFALFFGTTSGDAGAVGSSVIQPSATTGFVNASSDIISLAFGASEANIARSVYENKPISVWLTGNNLTGGNGTVTISIAYRIVQLP